MQLPRTDAWSYRIIDATGRVVATERAAGDSILVDLSDYSSGVYAITVQDSERSHTTKLLKP